jgi:uncharacterized OB-fold protein
VSAPTETLPLSRCESCGARFLPTDGSCPRCGAVAIVPYDVPALGTVLAATELTSPAEGWSSPHRLALVELPDAVRLIAIIEGPLPVPHTIVALRREAGVYRARTEPEP